LAADAGQGMSALLPPTIYDEVRWDFIPGLELFAKNKDHPRETINNGACQGGLF
jgi:hypothetical protein